MGRASRCFSLFCDRFNERLEGIVLPSAMDMVRKERSNTPENLVNAP